MLTKRDTYILGGGVSGLAALRYLTEKEISATVFEKEQYAGGLCRTAFRDGYYFDKGIHVSFTKNEVVKDFLTKSLGNENIVEGLINPHNFIDGRYCKHPVQCNLYGMEKKIVSECLSSYIENYYKHDKKIPVNFDEWLTFNFGECMSNRFIKKYNKKIWNFDLANMGIDWIGKRVYQPKIKEVVDGAIGLNEELNFYYYDNFRYPKKGGFVSFFREMIAQKNIITNAECTSIDFSRREITINDREKYHFEHIISTIPLPELVKITKGVPAAVKRASDQLYCNKIMLLNFKLNRVNEVVSSSAPKWIYFYDDDIPFARGHFPHLLSDSCAPVGKYAFQAEQYALKNNEFKHSEDVFLDKSIKSLIKTGIITDKGDIDDYFFDQIDYAYIIHSHERDGAVDTIRDFFTKNNIHTCGRFGEWTSLWSDQSMISGNNAGELLWKDMTSH